MVIPYKANASYYVLFDFFDIQNTFFKVLLTSFFHSTFALRKSKKRAPAFGSRHVFLRRLNLSLHS